MTWDREHGTFEYDNLPVLDTYVLALNASAVRDVNAGRLESAQSR